jgi:O-glycosyl hydrolase
MKFESAIFAAILLTMTSKADAFCQPGDTEKCTVNGKPGIAQCDPKTGLFGSCSTDVLGVPKITIDGNSVHQTIDGFGTSEDTSAPNLYHWADAPHILDLAFSQERGIGLTIFRSQIVPELNPNKDTFNDLADPEQLWTMKEAVSRGVTKVFGSVWSPTAWMKTNGQFTNCDYNDKGEAVNCVDGALKTENYQDFADLLSHYANEYARTNAVDIYAVSIQNEPDVNAPWGSCKWTPTQIKSFLADYLSPTFAANHIGAKVIAPETSGWNLEEKYMSETYKNPAAAGRLDIAAAHLYGGDPSKIFQDALTHGKKIWQTEASTNYNVFPGGELSNALSWATLIHQSLTDAEVNAWVWYIFAAKHVDGTEWPNMLISLEVPPDAPNSNTGKTLVSKSFWALGNFSKFVRPGFVRIDALPTPYVDPSLYTSAYKDPVTGQFVIVTINASTHDIDVKFDTVGFPGWTSSSVTPYITSGGDTQNLSPQPTVSLANIVTIPAQSVVSYVSPPANVSLHQPDGLILSTGNIYFTSHDAAGAHVFRTAQTSTPAQEIELYSEGLGNRFGDIVFAKIGDEYYGYFWATNGTGKATIKRILLTGSQVATVLTPDLNNIDIVNSHHNLATDGVNLYWQDVSSVRKMPIGGGAITTLDETTPNTPPAGVYLSNGTIVYASVAAVRYVPTSGADTPPSARTIANASATVTTILPVANGTYWGDRNGAIQLKLGSTISTVQASAGLVPTSIGTNGYTAGGALVWTKCTSSTCQTGFDFPAGNWVSPVANNALGAAMNSSGSVFWGDDYGVHRLDF